MRPMLQPILFIFLLLLSASAAATDDPHDFDDFPLAEPLTYPKWFKQSFLDLQEDLNESIENGKQGIIVYFGQKRCAYCRMLMDVNFGQKEIENYTREHFDLIPIDIWGVQEVTDTKGHVLTERDYSLREGTNFTPSLLFYNADGDLVLRLRGYYPPYQFMAALQYVAEGHYKREKFRVYLARGDKSMRFEKDDLVEEEFFSPPPYNLDRTRFPGERPLVVFFEQGDCHACDVLHTEPLKHMAIAKLFSQFESVQLNMHRDTPVITPQGEKTTARKWAEELDIFYAPSMVFFDENGKEIIRLDSVVRFFRLRNVLNYVISGSYNIQPSFQKWRSESGF
ncbi:MAG: thioredoxin fold domain-containing protein [Chromatiales bacterium]